MAAVRSRPAGYGRAEHGPAEHSQSRHGKPGNAQTHEEEVSTKAGDGRRVRGQVTRHEHAGPFLA